MAQEPDTAVQQILDRQAIRDAVFRYCRGVDRGDAALINSAYHPDAVDQHGNSRYTGETVGPAIVDLMTQSRISMHHVTNQLIQFTGPNTAVSETYYTVWQTVDKGGQERIMHSIGRYLDRFERKGGDWRIADRVVVVEFVRLDAVGDAMTASRPDMGRRDATDPSYELFRPGLAAPVS